MVAGAMPLDWSQPLTRTLVLKSGGELRTLHDVAEAFLRRFGNVRHDHVTAHAIELEPFPVRLDHRRHSLRP